ncbi:hypothetical protein HPB49_000823 [Dermacentor silvarum]|uniref:Uncharacterized protein n=1 Tax=Dermacentor silvarum TaxID=543639 RepID=A0ACB8D9P2_DERSI|nr:hypothetical protein HPB49_000823 [Dermacentor silvarum]
MGNVAELERELGNLKRDLRKEIRDLKQSVEFMSKQYEDVNSECESVKAENAALKAAQEPLLVEIQSLKKQVRENASKITAQDQYSRNKNIEVKGIPCTENENLRHVLGKVGDALGVTITENDIEACHRVPVRNAESAKNIVVAFAHRTKRDEVIAKARRSRLTTQDIGFSDTKSVFVNEHLCPQLKKLLGMTVAKKKAMKWSFAWVKNGKVLARKTENSNVIRISSEEDLMKIC